MQSESKSKQKHSGDSATMKTVADLKRSDTLWLIRLSRPAHPLSFRISLVSFLFFFFFSTASLKGRRTFGNYLVLGNLPGTFELEQVSIVLTFDIFERYFATLRLVSSSLGCEANKSAIFFSNLLNKHQCMHQIQNVLRLRIIDPQLG